MRKKQFIVLAAAVAAAGSVAAGCSAGSAPSETATVSESTAEETTAEETTAEETTAEEQPAEETAGGTLAEYTAPDDMTVASSVYGWVVSDAEITSDNQVSVTIMPAGASEPVIYTTAVSYGITNAMTQTTQARSIAGRCVKAQWLRSA